jgi:hypothetical protein
MVKQTITSPPSGYKAPKMPWDLKDSFGTAKPIPIPSIPEYFFPGTKPIKALAGANGGEQVSGSALPEPSDAAGSKRGKGVGHGRYAGNTTVTDRLRRRRTRLEYFHL